MTGLPIKNRRVQVEGITAPESFKVEALPAVIPADEIWHVCSGDCWSVKGIIIQAGAELRIDGEVHTWGDVTGTGIMTGEGELRLH